MKNIDRQLVECAIITIRGEHIKLMSMMRYDEIVTVIPTITHTHYMFSLGAGRTGLVIKAAAMRLMWGIRFSGFRN